MDRQVIGEIKVGIYTIMALDDGTFWIEGDGGEGLSCSRDFIDCVNDFYEENI